MNANAHREQITVYESLNIKPGTVLSNMKPTTPPTNMLVLSSTVKIWSASSLPETRRVMMCSLCNMPSITINRCSVKRVLFVRPQHVNLQKSAKWLVLCLFHPWVLYSSATVIVTPVVAWLSLTGWTKKWHGFVWLLAYLKIIHLYSFGTDRKKSLCKWINNEVNYTYFSLTEIVQIDFSVFKHVFSIEQSTMWPHFLATLQLVVVMQ